MSSSLNITQERELIRLLDYEHTLYNSNSEFNRCAFPYRPENDLQAELIERNMLAIKQDSAHGTVVVITSDGYSYFPEKDRQTQNKIHRDRREARLIGLTALFCSLCMLAGFFMGYILG